jgi:hypothetical protein
LAHTEPSDTEGAKAEQDQPGQGQAEQHSILKRYVLGRTGSAPIDI